jgi:hypothetical protein
MLFVQYRSREIEFCGDSEFSRPNPTVGPSLVQGMDLARKTTDLIFEGASNEGDRRSNFLENPFTETYRKAAISQEEVSGSL